MFKLFYIKSLEKEGGGPPVELSYSRISAYRFCPWKYKLLYEDRLKIAPTPQISLGHSIHGALEKYHEAKGQTLDQLLEAYAAEWVNEGFTDAQQTQQYYERGKKMLEDYHAFSLTRQSEIVGIEKEFNFPLGKRVLRGIIDRIDRLPDGSYEVIDYKTHAEIWDQARIDSDLQLTLYAIGCKKGLEIEPTRFSYFFLAHNRVISTERNATHEAAALAELESTAQKIEQKEFTANTEQCPKCDFKLSCKYSPLKKPKS